MKPQSKAPARRIADLIKSGATASQLAPVQVDQVLEENPFLSAASATADAICQFEEVVSVVDAGYEGEVESGARPHSENEASTDGDGEALAMQASRMQSWRYIPRRAKLASHLSSVAPSEGPISGPRMFGKI